MTTKKLATAFGVCCALSFVCFLGAEFLIKDITDVNSYAKKLESNPFTEAITLTLHNFNEIEKNPGKGLQSAIPDATWTYNEAENVWITDSFELDRAEGLVFYSTDFGKESGPSTLLFFKSQDDFDYWKSYIKEVYNGLSAECDATGFYEADWVLVPFGSPDPRGCLAGSTYLDKSKQGGTTVYNGVVTIAIETPLSMLKDSGFTEEVEGKGYIDTAIACQTLNTSMNSYTVALTSGRKARGKVLWKHIVEKDAEYRVVNNPYLTYEGEMITDINMFEPDTEFFVALNFEEREPEGYPSVRLYKDEASYEASSAEE